MINLNVKLLKQSRKVQRILKTKFSFILEVALFFYFIHSRKKGINPSRRMGNNTRTGYLEISFTRQQSVILSKVRLCF